MDAAPPPQNPPAVVIDESVFSLAALATPATWHVAAPIKFTTLDGRSAWLAGARLGLLKRERHVLSFAGFSRLGGAPPVGGASYRRLDFRYLGLVLGWEGDGLGLFQSYGHALVGAGEARVQRRPASGGASASSKPLLILEPELGLTWKIVRAVRGTLGLSWRGAWGNTLEEFSRRDFDGWAATVGLTIGTYPSMLPPGGVPTPRPEDSDRSPEALGQPGTRPESSGQPGTQ
jgi:hypothetical protein